ncbi:uncharacterized protein LOC114281548 [Camellia sinensis]|uniref:uncharacterized protein LOC114281548 n=1 Tax=Camellia sinensis TaxID=4442 RepID=UPI001036A61A|nr:uncharacterized protein LOC114281548 [Camellia sinensis]
MVRTRTEDPEDATYAQLDRMERMIMEMAETLWQQHQQPQPQPPPPPVPPPVVQDFHAEDRTITLMKEFKKMKPPSFKGGIELMIAEAWVLGIEKLFEVFLCTEVQKVQLATFTLEDEAQRWCMLTGTVHQGLTWDKFLELFYDKYFPQSMRDKKVIEFQTLRQGNKTVAEYEAQFAELARFAPHMVDTDYKKAQKFEGELRGAILDRVNMLELPTYVDMLERAVIAEGNLAAQSRISEWKGKRQNNQLSTGSTTPPSKKQNSGTSSASTLTPDSTPICSECGKKHRGTCYQKSGAYFSCGKTGHLVRDCPQRNQKNGNRAVTSLVGSTPTSNTKSVAKPANNKDTVRQGRVFTLVPGDVQNAATVVSGTFIIHGHSDHILFDSGSTYSFVSKLFAQNLDKFEEVLPYMLCVSSPLGDSLICTSVYFACELQVGDIRGHGMTFPPYLISEAKACNLIQKVGQGYLCIVLEGQVMSGNTDMIPVVCEFLDVVTEELLGELVDREIKFTIEMALGTQPISKTPYRMSPVEMKELKIQL